MLEILRSLDIGASSCALLDCNDSINGQSVQEIRLLRRCRRTTLRTVLGLDLHSNRFVTRGNRLAWSRPTLKEVRERARARERASERGRARERERGREGGADTERQRCRGQREREQRQTGRDREEEGEGRGRGAKAGRRFINSQRGRGRDSLLFTSKCTTATNVPVYRQNVPDCDKCTVTNVM
jgi:hypothetical protein